MKTSDKIAFFALIISLATAAYNSYQWLQGAVVRFAPPAIVQVQANCIDWEELLDGEKGKCKEEKGKCKERANLEIVGDSFIYANHGAPGSKATVLYEEVVTQVKNQEIILDWKYFTNYVQDQEGREGQVAAPMAIVTTSVESHETEFAPKRLAVGGSDNEQMKNYVPWSTFVSSLDEQENVKFKFQSYVLEGKKVILFSAQCHTQFSRERIDRLNDPKYERAVLTCRYKESPKRTEINREDLPLKLNHVTDFLK